MYFQVIMPVGSNPSRAEKEEIIRKVADKAGMKPHFPRYTTEDPVFNLQATLQDIRGAEFILADLSLERPSCYYELGLSEALGKPVYLIAIKGTDIHQTASRRLVRYYDDNAKFENLVVEILKEAVGNN